MVRRTCATIGLFGVFMILTGHAFAVDVTVTYVQGTVESNGSGSWQAVVVGDAVDSGASLRLSSGAFVELAATGGTIRLGSKGTFLLGPLVAQLAAPSHQSVLSTLAGAMKMLGSGGARTDSALFGARAAQAAGPNETTWAQSDAQVYVSNAKAALTAGRYTQAIGDLQSSSDFAVPEELPEIDYYLAFAYAMTSDIHDAIRTAESVTITGREQWAPDYVLLRARLYVEANAYPAAIAWLTAHADAVNATDGARTALRYFLLGLSYRGTGDLPHARDSLTRAASSLPGSDLASTAQQLLAGM